MRALLDAREEPLQSAFVIDGGETIGVVPVLLASMNDLSAVPLFADGLE